MQSEQRVGCPSSPCAVKSEIKTISRLLDYIKKPRQWRGFLKGILLRQQLQRVCSCDRYLLWFEGDTF